MKNTINEFIEELRSSIGKRTFVKLTLGNYKGSEPHLQRILARLIETRRGTRVSLQSKYDQREIVKNFAVDEACGIVGGYLENGFRNAHLFTTSGDLQLDIGKRSARINRGKPTFTAAPTTSHDRERTYSVDPGAYYLKALGITNDAGNVRSEQRDKWKQINKFVEVLGGLFERSELQEKRDLQIVDMGSGKGYLTFAAYDHFANKLGLNVVMTGVDTRADMVTLCNSVAEASDFTGLRFEQGTIEETQVVDADIVIALHACDTATDDAIFKGIAAGADLIVAAPCCHREVRSQMTAPVLLAGVLKHPVLLDRTAETLTDGLRSLALEDRGYSTKMFEFVVTEHTPKNNLLVAVKRPEKTGHRMAEIAEIRKAFGIGHQRLIDRIASTAP